MSKMTIAQAVAELEVLAETGQLKPELVATIQEGLTLHESRHERKAKHAMIVNRLSFLSVGPLDVLVLRLPEAIIRDEAQMRQVHRAATDIADVAKRGVVILQEDAPLTVETLPKELRDLMQKPKPAIAVPERHLILPPGVNPGS